MKIKLFAILLILADSYGVKAQSVEYLDSNGSLNYNNWYGAPSENYDGVDFCIKIENTWGSWFGQFDRTYITGGDGATGLSFVVRMEEFTDIAIIYEGYPPYRVPKAIVHGVGYQYYTTYNITPGYYGPVLVRIIKNSIDDYSDGWSEWDFHYLRGIWWTKTWI